MHHLRTEAGHEDWRSCPTTTALQEQGSGKSFGRECAVLPLIGGDVFDRTGTELCPNFDTRSLPMDRGAALHLAES